MATRRKKGAVKSKSRATSPGKRKRYGKAVKARGRRGKGGANVVKSRARQRR
mgnify:CR=1 FL=1